jgi:hypothetical protein
LCANEAYGLYQSENLQSLRDSDNGLVITTLSLIHAGNSRAGLEEEVRRSHERLANTQPGDNNHRAALHQIDLIYLPKYQGSNDQADLEQSIKYQQNAPLIDPQDPQGDNQPNESPSRGLHAEWPRGVT